MPGSRLMQQVVELFKNLFKTLPDTLDASSQSLPKDVEPDEPLSSFVYRSSHVVKSTNTLHYTRLMPRPNSKTGRLETSVCRSRGLSDAQVWQICALYFDPPAPKPAIGRGVGPAKSVFNVGLQFDADGKPYPEHANIIGWRDAADIPRDELKHFWMDQAQRIASQFSYDPRPRPS